MKPILINLNEISDSREVYDSKPNTIITIFIYSILALFAAALLWMYFGRIDIVVKSDGMLRPDDQVATVMNTYSGTLELVNAEDGATVNQGDILYIIEHQELLKELEFYQEQLTDTEDTLALLEKYKRSVEDEVNYFAQTGTEEEYYLKYQAYEINYELMQHDYNYNEEEREINLSSIKDQLETLRTRLTNTKLLKKAVNNNENQFNETGSEKEYYNLFLKYQNDYNTLNTQYDNARTEIDNNATEEGLVDSLTYYQEVLGGLQKLKASIINGENEFDKESNYSYQYEEFTNKIADLTSSYVQAKENYEINKELEGLAVTEWDVQQSEAAMEDAKRAIDTYKVNYLSTITTNITDVEKKIEDITLTKENTVSKDILYEQNEADRKAALENFKLKYLVELDNTIASLADNITSLEANKCNLELQGDKALIYKEGDIEANLVKYKNNELQTTITTINTYTDKKDELQANIDKLNSQISETIVKASKSGVINSNIELVKGDVLSSGTQVLTIIPADNSEYKVSIYVSNKDIGKLSVGMKAKFNIYALPNSEYGYLTGTITSISKDLKVDQSSGSGYYLVEASLDNRALYDSQGNNGALKSGMACEAQMITENKRILTYVLGKIDLWIN